METSDWIALASTVIAAIALYMARKADRKVTINERKAQIHAITYKSGNLSMIKFWNSGNAPAKNIRIEKVNATIRFKTQKDPFPLPLLNNGDTFELSAVLVECNQSIPIIKIIWDDDFKKENEREQTLDF